MFSINAREINVIIGSVWWFFNDLKGMKGFSIMRDDLRDGNEFGVI